MRINNRGDTRDRRAGGVTMEYVILAVLIAAAVVVAVVVFSRSIAGMFITAGQSASLQETTAQKELNMRRQDRAADAGVSRQYHESMHE